jgi:excisionase family DNA binding protein
MNSHLPYTPIELAQLVGVKPSTVYAWISRKELKSYKHGRSRYITREHLQEFYEKRSTGEYIDLTYANGPSRSYQI